MTQIIIYTAVITATVVISAYIALHAGAFIFAYVVYCMGRSILGKEVSFRQFWKEIFPYPSGNPKMEDGE